MARSATSTSVRAASSSASRPSSSSRSRSASSSSSSRKRHVDLAFEGALPELLDLLGDGLDEARRGRREASSLPPNSPPSRTLEEPAEAAATGGREAAHARDLAGDAGQQPVEQAVEVGAAPEQAAEQAVELAAIEQSVEKPTERVRPGPLGLQPFDLPFELGDPGGEVLRACRLGGDPAGLDHRGG